MSRLPRLHSSPDRLLDLAPLATMNSKRKLFSDSELDEAADRPCKLPAITSSKSSNEPLRPSRKGITNVPQPPPLTRPRAPTLRTARATSAPPKSTTTIRGLSASTTGPIRPRAGVNARVASLNSNDKRFQDLESQLASVESARAADAARITADMAAEKTKISQLQSSQTALALQLQTEREQAMVHRKELASAGDEIEAMRKRHMQEIGELESHLRKKDREAREASEELRATRVDLERERAAVHSLKSAMSQQSTTQLTMSTQVTVLQSQLSAAQNELTTLREELKNTQDRVVQLEDETRAAEGMRRKLHNKVMELKGNIRVFCRVRPLLKDEGEQARLMFPPGGEEIKVENISESAMGAERKEVYNFGFDRVFDPSATQTSVFEEIEQLAQSCMDGYNVCIFAYGQTGSGKSFTMEGGSTEESRGMIPRAVDHIFKVATDLKSKGWQFTMEGQFLEIYNETINDLLGNSEFDKKKHEIKHDVGSGTTRVTDLAVHPLPSTSTVRTLLSRAAARRRVAATIMNERSSRSHSVFTVRVEGRNEGSGERLSGSLNLVDLAGSERLVSDVEERAKETKAINKSLSALGDVIAALGEKGSSGNGHVPYRNSKLTYLLQNSLSGNSKTLMILNLSPIAAHLNESLTSLRFATKVNNTSIGTAKKQSRTS